MFIFDKYTFDEKTKKAEFFYKIEKRNKENPKQFDVIHSFKEELDFSNVKFRENIDPWLLKNCLYFLHLTLGISYWKTTCEKGIKVFSGSLKRGQAHFFERLYKRGLGEFFYKNQIDFRGLVNFPYGKISGFRKREVDFSTHPELASGSSVLGENLVNSKSSKTCKMSNSKNSDLFVLPKTFSTKEMSNKEDSASGTEGQFKSRCLVPIGGGKDSTLTLSLLEKAGIDFDTITLGEYDVCNDIAEKFGKKVITVKRKIDPKLIEGSKSGEFYNGHVPISSIYAAVSVFVSAVSGYSHIVLSNEASANEENTSWNGMKINHQYSKSLEFEDYLQEFILNQIGNISYFSILRPFTEAKITKMFVENCEKTFDTFTSCNRNFVISKEKPKNKWCGECPKCAFVFVMFSAYLGVEKTTEILGKNLFEDESLVQMFKDLAGKGEMKPFECVGTYNEIQSAFAKVIQDGASGIVIDEIKKFGFKNNLEEFENYFGEHLIPEEFLEVIEKYS